MRILFIGDIFGRPGREIARQAIPALIERESLDFVIANVENSAAGFGVTGDIADTILELRRRRHDNGQSCLGQEGDPGLPAWPAEAAAPGELPRRRPGPRPLPGTDPHRRTDRRGQRHGPHLHAAPRRPVCRRAEGDRGITRQGARHHCRLPCRGNLRENCDGLAPGRTGHRGVRDAHARADRR